MKNGILLFLIFWLPPSIYSQNYSGKITDATTHLPVPYAAIFCKSFGIGVYSNEDGVFLITSKQSLEHENLIISCVGYQSKVILITGPDCGRVNLIPKVYNLDEVRIIGKDYEGKNFKYLDSLFQNYRSHSIKVKSKAYFSFTAEEDTIPLEFQELYYNAETSCRDGLEDLILKTGRIGNNKQNFLTVNVSDIFLSLKLFSVAGNINIPHSPTNFRYRNMRKLFYFTMVKTTPEKDKFLMVLEPRAKKIPYFSVSVFIDRSKNTLEKVEYSLTANYLHYFYPLLPNDKVRNFDLKLVYYFDNQEPFQIQQAGIYYGINYFSSSNNRNYFIKGAGKLVLFDKGKNYPLVLPPDLFKGQNNDYRIISSLPYDSLFWEIPGNSPLSSKNREFLNFFNIGKLSKTYNLKTQEASLSTYMPWQKSACVIYKDFDSVSRVEHKKNLKHQDVYNIRKNDIKTKIVLNYFYLSDSLHLTSATLIDIKDSYFEPDTGYNMIAFINLSFDLAEVFRRHIVNQIYGDKKFQHPEGERELKNLYNRLNAQLSDTLLLLKKQTENGSNLEMLLIWLKHMKDNYKIDRSDLADRMYYEDLYLKGRVIKLDSIPAHHSP